MPLKTSALGEPQSPGQRFYILAHLGRAARMVLYRSARLRRTMESRVVDSPWVALWRRLGGRLPLTSRCLNRELQVEKGPKPLTASTAT